MVLDGCPASGLFGEPSSSLAHKLPKIEGNVPNSETFPPTPEWLPCVGMHGQHIGSHQCGLCFCPIFRLVQQILLWAVKKIKSLRAVYILEHANWDANLEAC